MSEQQEPDAGTESAAGRKKWIIGGAVVLAIAAVGILMFRPGGAPSDAGAEGTPDSTAASGPPIYQSLHPALVVNLVDGSGKSHYMQISMDVMSRRQSTINAVREHTPAIRNALILLYGNADFEEIQTRQGKEKMLEEGRDEIARVVAEASGEDGVDAVYFTSLIVQ